uniref:Transcription initiation factor IIF subunit alpha n=1 Tax=Oryza brachyantha TaxID=4533 RepID=J3LM23_ORYBR
MARSGDCCPVCAAPVSRLTREYNVLLDTGEKEFTVGKFTTGVPPFSGRKNAGSRSWSLHNEGRQTTGNAWDNCNNRKSCILEDDTGEYQYQGQIQGLQSAASHYDLLMLNSNSKDLHAVPSGSWYKFNIILQYKQLTLEEAEENMSRRRSSATGYERWMTKAATNGAAAFSSDVLKLDDTNEGETGQVHLKKSNKSGDETKSDKGGEERSHLPTTKGREEDRKDRDFDLDYEIEKGDDWEHEEIFTDDDEAVDVNPEEGAELADPEIPAPPEIKQDFNEKHGGVGLSSGKELKKLLRRAAGQNESDDVEEDTDEDEPPSPIVAPKQPDQLKSASEEDNPSKPTASRNPCITPHASNSKQKRRKWGDNVKTSNGSTPKKPKIEPDTKKVVKEEIPCSLEPTSKPFASERSDTDVSPVTEEEIRTVFQLYAPIRLHDFRKDFMPRFSPRLRTAEDKQDFLATLKKISQVQKINGQKCMLLLDEYK